MSGRRGLNGFVAVILLAITATHALAGENPYPRDWFWGNDEQRAKQDAMIGQAAPDMVLSGWINGQPNGKALKNKILIIDFWATWCGPCIGSIPHNNEMFKKYAKDGVVLIGVCGSSSGQEKMESVAKEHGILYPVGKDDTQKAAEAWNVMWWPTYAVVDRDRVIRAVGLKPDYVDDVVDKILAEQPYEKDGESGSGEAAAEAASGTSGASGGDTAIDPKWLEGNPDQRARLAGLEGAAPPALAVENWINSESLTLADLKGKVVLVDFWTTWCGPCIGSIPHTNELQAKHRDDGLVIIGVCSSRGGETMGDSVKEHGIEYPVAVDIQGQTVDAYKVNGYPDYYLIDRAGNLRIADCRNGSVDDAVAALLAEPVAEQTAKAE